MAPGRPQQADRARLTSRAAVLAVVICAVALSLAYPIREYIAQRRQIDQLQAQRQVILAEMRHDKHQQQRLHDPAYIRQLAMDELYLCTPGSTCYVIVGNNASGSHARTAADAATPWYQRLWRSVKQADRSGVPR